MNPTDQSSRDRPVDLLATAIVAAAAIAFAVAMLATYYQHPDELWRNLSHDRSAHYGFGVDLAVALRTLNPIEYLVALEGVRIWAPLHPAILGVVLASAGIDYRLAIVPSLIGWVMTVVLTWLIARHLFVDRVRGMVAGTVAAIFAIASPEFRALASDVMLETLGAGLTALSVWLYMRAIEAPHDYGRWRALALGLTLLFLEKQNYWLLAVVSLALAVVSEAPRDWLARTRQLIAEIPARDVVRNSFKDPLLIAFAVVCMLILGLLLKGPTVVSVFDHRISLYPPGNLMAAAWALLLIRITILWYRHRAVFNDRIAPAGRAMFYWHAVPIGCFLLLPQRLGFLLFFVSPANSLPEQHFGPWSGAHQYAQVFAEGYQAAHWSAALAAALALLAATQIRHLTSGARLVLILLVISSAAVVLHPNVEGRYMASWIFTVWILAGAGAAIVVYWLTSRLSAAPRAAVAAILLCVVVLAHVHASQSHAAAAPVGSSTAPASDLDLAAAYLPAIAGFKHVGFVLSFKHNFFITWSVREGCQCRARIDMPDPALPASREQVRQVVEAWVESTPAERIVAIDTFGRYNQPGQDWADEQARGMMDGMATQHRFERIQTVSLPSYPADVTIWAPRPATPPR